jgi:hypothetical protein
LPQNTVLFYRRDLNKFEMFFAERNIGLLRQVGETSLKPSILSTTADWIVALLPEPWLTCGISFKSLSSRESWKGILVRALNPKKPGSLCQRYSLYPKWIRCWRNLNCLFPSVSEIKQCLRFCNATGLRASELTSLTLKDLSLDMGYIYLCREG